MAADSWPLPVGVGVGWRPEIAAWVAQLPAPGFCEVIAEGIDLPALGAGDPAGPSRGVADLRDRGVPVLPHGVALSLGGTEPVARNRVAHLAGCAAALRAPLVSEHIAFVRAGGREAGHLLPVPRTREALDVLVGNVGALSAELDVPVALEPIATLLDWPEDEYSEADFVTELLERTGALLLLDLHNLAANAINRGRDPRTALHRWPTERIGYVHVAGGITHDGWYQDTHTAPVPSVVLDLLAELVARRGGSAPPVLLERDGHYPPAAELAAELGTIADAAGLPDPTRATAPRPAAVCR